MSNIVTVLSRHQTKSKMSSTLDGGKCNGKAQQRDAYPSDLRIEWGRTRYRGKQGHKCFNVIPPSSLSGKREGTAPCCQSASVPRDSGRNFDDALETLRWGRVSPGCDPSGLDSFETSLASLL